MFGIKRLENRINAIVNENINLNKENINLNKRISELEKQNKFYIGSIENKYYNNVFCLQERSIPISECVSAILKYLNLNFKLIPSKEESFILVKNKNEN